MEKSKIVLILAVVVVVIIAAVYYADATSSHDDDEDLDIPNIDDSNPSDGEGLPDEDDDASDANGPDFSKFFAPMKTSFSKGDYYTYQDHENDHKGHDTTSDRTAKVTSANGKKQIYTVNYTSSAGPDTKSNIGYDEVVKDFRFDISVIGHDFMKEDRIVGGLGCYEYIVTERDGEKLTNIFYFVSKTNDVLVQYQYIVYENDKETYRYESTLTGTNMLMGL